MEEFAKIALTAILTTLGTFFITRYTLANSAKISWVRRHDELERHAHYLAVRVVCNLDPFVAACCDVVSDFGMLDAKGERTPSVKLPTLALPEDVDWKALPIELMYRVLALPNDIEMARRAIDFVENEIAGPPDYDELFEERSVQFSQLGLRSLTLCDEMRKSYGIPDRTYRNWQPKSVLARAVTRTRLTQGRRSAHAAEMTDIITATRAEPRA